MAKDKNYMPQSTAGLVRYFDVEEAKIKLKPEHVVFIGLAFMAVVVVMKFMA